MPGDWRQVRVKIAIINELRKIYDYPYLSDSAIVNMALEDLIRVRSGKLVREEIQ